MTPSIPNARRIRRHAPRGVKQVPAIGNVVSSYSRQKLDAANTTHALLVEALTRLLESHGHVVEENQLVDAFAHLKTGPAIFEAKSLTDENEISQVRSGLSQLYEYRFRHGIGDASLWLVLSRAPSEHWLVNYLEDDRGINVIWFDAGEIAGPSARRLTESGSEALRRAKRES